MRENNVKFKTGNNKREDKESSLPPGYSLKLRWEEVDRRFSKNRDLYQDLAKLEPRRLVDAKMKQESNKSLLFKISPLASVSLEMLMLTFANCYQQHCSNKNNS